MPNKRTPKRRIVTEGIEKHLTEAAPTAGSEINKAAGVNLITDTELHKGGVLWVVMNKERSTVLTAPGLTKPWSTRIKKHAEEVARANGGVVEMLREAIKLVAKHPANRPKG